LIRFPHKCEFQLLHNTCMTAITKEILANAIIAVRDMDLRQCEQLSDEIHANQPQLLLPVLALRSFGVTPEQLEVPLNALLVCYQCMKTCDRQWPLISEAMWERCSRRLVARMQFNEGLTPAQAAEAITTTIAEHNERWLLAFVYGELVASNSLVIESEAQKYLVLVTLALVESIAEAS